MSRHDINLDLFFSNHQERDVQYNARATVADFSVFVKIYADLSQAAANSLPCRLDVAYGDTMFEKIDIFHAPPNAQGNPVLIYLHGGYWRALSRKDSAFMAQSWTRRGVSVVAIEYALAPDASLEQIVGQCRSAIAHIYHHAPDYGINRDRMHIAGSSAGGHLCAMLLTDGWQESHALPGDVIKSASMLSGLFDIRPLCDSHINEWMKLTPQCAASLSPALLKLSVHAPVLLAVGALETQGFQRQTAAFADTLHRAGAQVETLTVEDRHHFDIVLDMNEVGSAVTQAMWRLIAAA
ncbi:alpha/beta hydrolase [Undibacterium sp. TS12]|uniref:alpha/beta hydrolase n=1 Tax=Undibacterium sp. TS12 TaxID=2908202 RepID=UPI001F4D02F9|nr:alpha/beta hydrolase [Undibacterium sp. TS12]MCH8621632.1 alpha/beta hydrolase [Undibacterium sp. TS12]